MSHPSRNIRHPVLTRVRRLVAKWPEAVEVEAWGHPTFRAGKKMFAGFGMNDAGEPSMSIKQTHDGQAALLGAKGFYRPPYVGDKGWIGVRVAEVDWPIVAELLEQGYRLVALKRMLKAMDGGERT